MPMRGGVADGETILNSKNSSPESGWQCWNKMKIKQENNRDWVEDLKFKQTSTEQTRWCQAAKIR